MQHPSKMTTLTAASAGSPWFILKLSHFYLIITMVVAALGDGGSGDGADGGAITASGTMVHLGRGQQGQSKELQHDTIPRYKDKFKSWRGTPKPQIPLLIMNSNLNSPFFSDSNSKPRLKAERITATQKIPTSDLNSPLLSKHNFSAVDPPWKCTETPSAKSPFSSNDRHSAPNLTLDTSTHIPHRPPIASKSNKSAPNQALAVQQYEDLEKKGSTARKNKNYAAAAALYNLDEERSVKTMHEKNDGVVNLEEMEEASDADEKGEEAEGEMGVQEVGVELEGLRVGQDGENVPSNLQSGDTPKSGSVRFEEGVDDGAGGQSDDDSTSVMSMTAQGTAPASAAGNLNKSTEAGRSG